LAAFYPHKLGKIRWNGWGIGMLYPPRVYCREVGIWHLCLAFKQIHLFVTVVGLGGQWALWNCGIALKVKIMECMEEENGCVGNDDWRKSNIFLFVSSLQLLTDCKKIIILICEIHRSPKFGRLQRQKAKDGLRMMESANAIKWIT
jgi:hypothetical protein